MFIDEVKSIVVTKTYSDVKGLKLEPKLFAEVKDEINALAIWQKFTSL